MKLYSPAVITVLMEKHKFKISKALGQNFLVDKNITEKIISAAGIGKGDFVVEIGAGMGVLTVAAADLASKVFAIEKDKALIPILKEVTKEYNNVEIILNDALKENINELAKGSKIKVIGNLPYYIATTLIMKILEQKTNAESLTVMVQKEVADRIKAGPGTKSYGTLSLAVNYYCQIEHVTDVPGSVFIPKPDVDSTVLKLIVRKEPPVSIPDETIFFSCIKAGFGQRRKTLLNSLTGLYGLDKSAVARALSGAGIDPKRRGETLSIFEFAELSRCIGAER